MVVNGNEDECKDGVMVAIEWQTVLPQMNWETVINLPWFFRSRPILSHSLISFGCFCLQLMLCCCFGCHNVAVCMWVIEQAERTNERANERSLARYRICCRCWFFYIHFMWNLANCITFAVIRTAMVTAVPKFSHGFRYVYLFGASPFGNSSCKYSCSFSFYRGHLVLVSRCSVFYFRYIASPPKFGGGGADIWQHHIFFALFRSTRKY